VSPAQVRALVASRATCDGLAPGSGLTDREVVEALKVMIAEVERLHALVLTLEAQVDMLECHRADCRVTLQAGCVEGTAEERAAVVSFLRVGAALEPRSPLAGYADAIERGEHRREEE
jgi:hypothetical protein